MVSLLIALFLDRGDPHDSVVFTIRKLLFHFSCFFFFTTKITKNRCKNTVSKNHQKMMVRASILGPRIDENRRREARKALKLRKNIVFGRNRFFIVFLMHFSMNFGSPGRPRGRPKSTVPLLFSTFLLACRFRAAPGVSWDRFGSIFHRFSVDFGTILVDFLSFFFVNLLSFCCPSWANFGLFFLHAHAFKCSF